MDNKGRAGNEPGAWNPSDKQETCQPARQAMTIAKTNVLSAKDILPPDDEDIGIGFRDTRAMVRAMADTLPDAERQRLAQAFGQKLVSGWWAACCLKRKAPLKLRSPPQALEPYPLNETLGGVADTAGRRAGQLEPEIAAYQIGLIYTSLLPPAFRSENGIYYTPPVLTQRLIKLASETGVDWKSCRVLDPACGGGAFLAPVARHIIGQMSECSPRILLENLSNRLRGYEIDPFGAWLAQVTLDVVLLPIYSAIGKKTPCLVTQCDSLRKNPPRAGFDLVIGNPPYARTQLAPELREKFKRGIYGHANLYGVFTDAALRFVRPGGVIAFVTPTSFLAGAYFKNLRALLGFEAPPKHLDFVAARQHVFDDVLQETLLATYQRDSERSPVKVHELHVHTPQKLSTKELGTIDLPANPSLPWILPRSSEQVTTVQILQRCRHTLADWGYTVSTGPLVWNRHKGQIFQHKARNRLPLIWAESVRPDGRFSWRAHKKNHEPWFEIRKVDSWLVSRQQCVLLQRTTAKEQHRRLIAATLPKDFIRQHGGVVVENHLNMLKPLDTAPRVAPDVLAEFLNSKAADQAFRCVSGSVAVSAYELEALPLPPPDALDRLHGLISAGATRQAIENECQRLYRG